MAYVLAVVSNRGGVGKSSIVMQTAAQYAKDNPTKNVLLLDTSIHVQEPLLPNGGFKTRGAETIATIPMERTCAGFLRAVQGFKAPEKVAPIFGGAWGLFGAPKAAASTTFVWRDHAVKVVDKYKDGGAAGNLWMASGGPELFKLIKDLDEVCDVALKLKAAFASPAFADTVVFIDTDAELGACFASTVGLAVASKLCVVLSSQWHDYQRLLSDVFNGMFSGLEFLANKDPKFCAKIDRIIINRVNATTYDDKKSSDETVEVLRGSLNFTVSKPDGESVAEIINHLRKSTSLTTFFADQAALSSEKAFITRYVKGLNAIPASLMQYSMQRGSPIASGAPPSSAKTGDAHKHTSPLVKDLAQCFGEATIK